jgi:hypothetical protein
MATRCSALTSLGLSLVFATGCPEPDDEAGEEVGETADTGESGDTGWTGPSERTGSTSNGGGGVEEGGDVRAPNDTGNDDEGEGDGDGDAGDGDGDSGGLEHCWDQTWNGNTLPAVIFDNTIGRDNDFIGSCGIGAAPDFQLGFIAPWAGSFTFDTEGSFDTVVYVHDGECGSEELACNDDFIGLDSKLTVQLDAFQIVTVTVDGAGPFEEGPFVLNISEADPPTCEPENIVPDLPAQVIGDTTGGPSELVGDCGGTDAPERVFEFVAPGPATYRFDTAGSSFDTVLYTLDACDGPPLDCSDDVDFTFQSEVIVDLEGGQKLTLVVDGHDSDDFGAFVLNVDEF